MSFEWIEYSNVPFKWYQHSNPGRHYASYIDIEHCETTIQQRWLDEEFSKNSSLDMNYRKQKHVVYNGQAHDQIREYRSPE